MLVFQCLKRKLLHTRLLKIKRTLVNNISEDRILNSGREEIEIPDETLPVFLTKFQTKFENHLAFECAETKRRYTYGEIRDRSTSLSKSLKKRLNLESGDVVAIILRNMPEFPIAYLGIMKANLVVTSVGSTYKPAEISNQLIDSGAKTIITEVALYSNVKLGIELTKKNFPTIVIRTKTDQSIPENAIDFDELIEVNSEDPEITPCSPNAVALMPYSSGTTGLPKGVELTHRNLVANALQALCCYVEYQKHATVSHQEVSPMILPYFHIFGQALMNGIQQIGGHMVSLPTYTQDLFISVLKDYRSTVLYLVPQLVLMLTYHPGVKQEYLAKVTSIISGGSPLAASDEQQLLRKFGHKIYFLQGYGLTEASPAVTQLCPSIMQEPEFYNGSVGRPIPNTEVKIVNYEDTSHSPLGPNKTGELLIKGPQIMKGYHNLPEETKNIMTEDGWLRTGDLGHFNEKGFLFITDRLKELIKVKGHQVAPAELEGILRSYPGVADAAVVGVPHETSGEVPRAFIVVVKDVDIEKLHNFINERVARYKQLKGGIKIIKAIPRNSSGKIWRKMLKSMYLEEKKGENKK